MRIILLLIALFSIAIPSKAMAIDLLNPLKEMLFSSDKDEAKKDEGKPVAETSPAPKDNVQNATKASENNASKEATISADKTTKDEPTINDASPSFNPQIVVPEFKSKTEPTAETAEEGDDSNEPTNDGKTQVIIKSQSDKKTGNELLDFDLQSFLTHNNVSVDEFNPAINNITKTDKITVQVISFNNYPEEGEDSKPDNEKTTNNNTQQRKVNTIEPSVGEIPPPPPAPTVLGGSQSPSTGYNEGAGGTFTPNSHEQQANPDEIEDTFSLNKSIIKNYEDTSKEGRTCYYKLRISNLTSSNLMNFRIAVQWNNLNLEDISDDIFVNFLKSGAKQDIKVFYNRNDCSFASVAMTKLEITSCDFSMNNLSRTDFLKYPEEKESLPLCKSLVKPLDYSSVELPKHTTVDELKMKIDNSYQNALKVRDDIAKKRGEVSKELTKQREESSKLLSEVEKEADEFIKAINKNEVDIRTEQNRLRTEMEEKLRQIKDEQEEKMRKKEEAAKKATEDAEEQKKQDTLKAEEKSSHEISKDGNTIKIHDKTTSE